MLQKFVEKVCMDLKIQVPEIKENPNIFKTKTSIACVADGIVYVKNPENINPDLLFAVAHELRHLWQFKTDKDFYFKDYNEDSTDVRKYNLQIAEIDANAYGGMIMIDNFNLKPLYQGLDKDIVDKIYKRIEEIRKSA